MVVEVVVHLWGREVVPSEDMADMADMAMAEEGEVTVAVVMAAMEEVEADLVVEVGLKEVHQQTAVARVPCKYLLKKMWITLNTWQ